MCITLRALHQDAFPVLATFYNASFAPREAPRRKTCSQKSKHAVKSMHAYLTAYECVSVFVCIHDNLCA